MDQQRRTMLTSVLEKLALGECGVRCEIFAEHDEMDAIAYSINVLAEGLEITLAERNRDMEELEALNEQLEQRVGDRKAALREREAKLDAIVRNSHLGDVG